MAGLRQCNSILLLALVLLNRIRATLGGDSCINTDNNQTRSSEKKESEEDTIGRHARDIIQWLRNGGGFIHEKLEIRRRIPGDRNSISGVFAREDIPADELILHVPRNLHLSIPREEVAGSDWYFGNYDEYEDVDDYEDDYKNDLALNTCRLSKVLLKEIQLYRESPSSSRYAPYIRYLEETQSKGQLPATYSPEGKQLLRLIQGTDKALPPMDLVDWIDRHQVEKGCFRPEDEENYHAAALVSQRGYDLEFIPVWDMVNHDVEERWNVKTNKLRSEEGLKVWASKPIAAGQEILYTYNYCEDCDDVGNYWGTPGIYRDFGFLEEYPQTWPFQNQNVLSQIRRDETRPDHFYATFLSEDDLDDEDDDDEELEDPPYYFSPDENALQFFREQLSRLKRLDINSLIREVSSPLEQMMIKQYYDSLRIAISSIIEASSSEAAEL